MCLLFFEVYFIVFNVQGVRHSPNIAPTKVSDQEGITYLPPREMLGNSGLNLRNCHQDLALVLYIIL
jgi:hypothetical protein